jgi:hypothetical protein
MLTSNHRKLRGIKLKRIIWRTKNGQDCRRKPSWHTPKILAVASDQIFDLEQANLSLSKMSDQYQSVAQKSELLLKSRTERFVAFCERKEEEIQRIKSRATAKIMSLEKQHGVDLSQMEAELYRKDWTHTKEVVKYKTTIEHLNKSHE